jgi:hypothetical protein
LKINRLLLHNNSILELPQLAFWGLEFHLETLDLAFNKLSSVPSDALKLLRNLRSLILTSNRITMLRHFDFGYLLRLDVLALDKNPIYFISPTAFVGTHLNLLQLDHISLSKGLEQFPTEPLSNLQGLTLSHNSISSIPKLWFQHMHSLRYVKLDGNALKILPNDTFAGLEDTLRQLQLNGNGLVRVPVVNLRYLSMLEELSLAGNRIYKIYANSFNRSKLMKTLDLSYNAIASVHHHAFHGLDNVRSVDLRFNRLYTFDDRTFYWPQPAGRIQVWLSHNPWLCNCQIRWMKHDYKWQAQRFQIVADRRDLLCERPNSLKGRPIIHTQLKEFTCNHDYFIYFYYEDPEENEIINVDDDGAKETMMNDDEFSGSGSGYDDDDDTEKGNDVEEYNDEIEINNF